MTKSAKAWLVMLLAYVATLALMLITTFQDAPETIESQSDLIISGVLFWALKSLPLLLFIPGLIKRSHYAASWLAYAVMLYFVIAVAFGSGSLLWLKAGTLCVLFLAALLFTRWKKAEERA